MRMITKNTTVNDLYNLNLIGGRTKNHLLAKGACNVEDIIRLKKEGVLSTIGGFGAKCMYEVNHVMALANDFVLVDDSALATPEEKKMGKYESFLANYNAKITPEKKAALENIYENGLKVLGVRAKHLLEHNFPTMKSLFATMASIDCHPLFDSKNKSNQEVARFISNFTESFYAILDGNDTTLAVENMKYRYVFLNHDEAAFVTDYKNKNGVLPLLFMLKAYVEKNGDRICRLSKKYYGIGCEPMAIEDIAEEEKLTRERVRQIIVERRVKSFLDEMIGNVLSDKRYAFMKNDCIMFDDEMFNIVRNYELGMCTDETVYGLAAMVGGFSTQTINGKLIMVSQNMLSEGRLRELVVTTQNKYNAHRHEAVTFSVHSFMKHKRFSEKKSNSLVKLVIDVFRKYCDAQVNGGMITLENNCFNYSKAVEEILSASKTPMSIKDILNKVKHMEGGEDACEFDIRYAMKRSDKFAFIGNTGTYTMADRDVYKGTIRGLVEDTMKASDKYCMHIDEIVKTIMEVFPTTNKRSIKASIDGCTSKFMAVGQGYYALAEAC